MKKKYLETLFLVLIVLITVVESMYILKLLGIGIGSPAVLTFIVGCGFSIGDSMLQIVLILFAVTLLLISLFILMKYLEVPVKLIKRIQLLFMVLAIVLSFLMLVEFISVFSKQGLNILWLTGSEQLLLLVKLGMTATVLFSEYIVFSMLARFVLSKEERENQKI